MRDAARRIIRRVGRRDRRQQHPVRREPRERADDRHRDEPARVAIVGAGVEGHRVSDREDRREARARLPPRRDPERHHAPHARVLRADHRLHRREDPAVELREVPGGRSHADDADEVGRRGDGNRAHVQGGVPQGHPLARARQPRRAAVQRRQRTRTNARGGRRGAAEAAGGAERSADVGDLRGARARMERRDAARVHAHRSAGSCSSSPRSRSSRRPRACSASGRCRPSCCSRSSGPASATSSSPASSAWTRPPSASVASTRASCPRTSASTRARRSSSRSRRTCTARTSRSASRIRTRRRRSSSSAAGRTASGRGSSSTTAAVTPPLPSARRASRR